jgi:hypothetical protein
MFDSQGVDFATGHFSAVDQREKREDFLEAKSQITAAFYKGQAI